MPPKSNIKLDKALIERISNIPKGYSNFRIYFYFWLGIVAAILLRAVPLIGSFEPLWAKISWYASILGYSFFFLHRYNVSTRRKRVVRKLDLLKKIENHEPLDIIDYHALTYILWSLSVSKEKLNYMIILIFSFIAICLGLIIDLG
jgi:hypothetical protein